MKGIVWGATFESAKKKLKEIEKQYKIYKRAEIINKRESKGIYEIEYSNGDHWKAVKCHECSRGCRANVSYIDNQINTELIQCIILPCTTAAPYNAIQYYWGKED